MRGTQLVVARVCSALAAATAASMFCCDALPLQILWAKLLSKTFKSAHLERSNPTLPWLTWVKGHIPRHSFDDIIFEIEAKLHPAGLFDLP